MNMLTKQQILLLHTQLIRQSGGTDGVRDEGMLDSAISQPLQTFDNMELYPGIVDKSVRLGYGLITNHPFVDGNKRIGTHAMLVTLDINGIELQYQDEDLIQLILKIASGKADDRVLRTWVLAHIA
ncbi:MAG: type II toxin-antitoxin system death-on-curing family toxin [Lactimicrobium massiliense]|nr:type II toxin-antitoxin system death-on-curing family toxin [Lactimicrobium massiliense]MDD6458617.1 type II toxin-antitoxin system death-on-curing family toxin [Lactimicrobium massiliense]